MQTAQLIKLDTENLKPILTVGTEIYNNKKVSMAVYVYSFK